MHLYEKKIANLGNHLKQSNFNSFLMTKQSEQQWLRVVATFQDEDLRLFAQKAIG